ncbi:MAG: hypothetical protein H8E44_11595 [Planctomycetes bacterium]|nr:hypothetical protein [Planctomycetota bacterium]MBL7038545.1 hypothetical protein [Pirellulaceae bacterium]
MRVLSLVALTVVMFLSVGGCEGHGGRQKPVPLTHDSGDQPKADDTATPQNSERREESVATNRVDPNDIVPVPRDIADLRTPIGELKELMFVKTGQVEVTVLEHAYMDATTGNVTLNTGSHAHRAKPGHRFVWLSFERSSVANDVEVDLRDFSVKHERGKSECLAGSGDPVDVWSDANPHRLTINKGHARSCLLFQVPEGLSRLTVIYKGDEISMPLSSSNVSKTSLVRNARRRSGHPSPEPSVIITREWTDSTGRYSVDAEFVEVTSDGEVVLKRSDNARLITVPLNRLSEPDRAYIRELGAKPATPAPAVPEVPKVSSATPDLAASPASQNAHALKQVAVTAINESTVQLEITLTSKKNQTRTEHKLAPHKEKTFALTVGGYEAFCFSFDSGSALSTTVPVYVDQPEIWRFYATATGWERSVNPSKAPVEALADWQLDYDRFVQCYRETLTAGSQPPSDLFQGKVIRWPLTFEGMKRSGNEVTLRFAGVQRKLTEGGLTVPWAEFRPARSALSQWERLSAGTAVTVHGTIQGCTVGKLTDRLTQEQIPWGLATVVQARPEIGVSNTPLVQNAGRKSGYVSPDVAAYITRSLELAEQGDKDKAFWHLTNALLFGHRTEEIKKAMETCPLAKASPGIPLVKDGKIDPEAQEDLDYWSSYVPAIDLPVEKLLDMVQVSPQWDDVEVKMLLHEDLVGDGKCSMTKTEETQFLCFLRRNQLTLHAAEQRYGKPAKVFESPGGAKYVFYGRFVLFQPVRKDRPCVLRLAK